MAVPRVAWRLFPAAVLVGLLLTADPGAAEIAPDALPALTGRVVDGANLLPQADRASIAAKLESLEDRSGIQFAVATVPSLGGVEIEPYANALFRKWKLGKKDENNGVLFLVAPLERKIRFEVGFGLEGQLTDALTKLILRNAVGPKLKANDPAGGINAGVDEVIAILTKDKSEWQARPALRADGGEPLTTGDVLILLVVGGFALIVVVTLWRTRRSMTWTTGPSAGWMGSSGSGWPGGSSSFGSSEGSGDSFSGGGGDSGGGGASDSY